MAALLLATSATAVLLLANTSAMLVNAAQAQDVVHRTLISHNAALHVHGCQASASGLAVVLRQRFAVRAADAPSPFGRQEDLLVEWRESSWRGGLAIPGPRAFRAQGAALCE